MKRWIAIPVLAVALITSAVATAQEKPNTRNTEKIIVIEKKSGDPGSTVKIDTITSVTVNGYKIDPEDIKSIRVFPRSGDGFRYNMRGSAWSPRIITGKPLSPSTFLGVMTKENEKGAEVVEVTKESPAEKAGIEKGDIITRVNDKTIKNPQELSEVIKAMKPGEKVTIQLMRGNQTKKVTAELGKKDFSYSITADSIYLKGLGRYNDMVNRDFQFDFNGPKPFVEGFFYNKPSMGLQIQDTENENGVTVLKVEPGSAADKAGVKVGDLITTVNGDKVSDVKSVLDEIRNTTGREYNLGITRDKKSLTITVKIPKKLKKADL